MPSFSDLADPEKHKADLAYKQYKKSHPNATLEQFKYAQRIHDDYVRFGGTQNTDNYGQYNTEVANYYNQYGDFPSFDGMTYHYVTKDGVAYVDYTQKPGFDPTSVVNKNLPDVEVAQSPLSLYFPKPKDDPGDDSNINWEYVGIGGAVVVGLGLLAVALS